MCGLDTSGSVGLSLSGKVDLDWMNETAWTFAALSPFTQGYIEALFAGPISAVSNLGKPYTTTAGLIAGFSDLAPEALARIIADCEAHQKAYGLPAGDARHGPRGEWFWKNRQAGMWEKDGFPPLTVQLGDDGKVRFAECAQFATGEAL